MPASAAMAWTGPGSRAADAVRRESVAGAARAFPALCRAASGPADSRGGAILRPPVASRCVLSRVGLKPDAGYRI